MYSWLGVQEQFSDDTSIKFNTVLIASLALTGLVNQIKTFITVKTCIFTKRVAWFAFGMAFYIKLNKVMLLRHWSAEAA